MLRLIRHVFVLIISLLYMRYIFVFIIIWGFAEIIIYSIKKRNVIKIKKFICNFITTIFNCIDILSNIVFQIPANRMLLNTKSHKFGDPKTSFTKILRLNFIYGNLKPRGLILYNIIQFFKNLLK